MWRVTCAICLLSCLFMLHCSSCPPGLFKCSSSPNNSTKLACVSNEMLCDGTNDCPNAEDEAASLCSNRTCSSKEFSCLRPGHCIAKSRRCDENFDCSNDKSDTSDEDSCSRTKQQRNLHCKRTMFQCKNHKKCIKHSYVCDNFSDCPDGSDEENCPVKCGVTSFQCDSKCLPSQKRCDGHIDCKDGKDEKGCKSGSCSFRSEFYCKSNGKCVARSFVCDGSADCDKGEDEVCPISTRECKSSGTKICKSGDQCLLKQNWCDGYVHCRDGSDEQNCLNSAHVTSSPAPPCPAPLHQCYNTTSTCVHLASACKNATRCPYPDSKLDQICRKIRHEESPCSRYNGGCEHNCNTRIVNSHQSAECSCREGYQVDPRHPKKCIDVNECQKFGICAQACENTIGSFRCSCNKDYWLSGTDCRARKAAKLLITTIGGLSHLSDYKNEKQITGDVQHPRFLTVDVKTNAAFVYTRDGVIRRIGLDGRSNEELVRDVLVDDLAYDWVRGLLFYSVPRTDSANGYIGIFNVTSGRRVQLRHFRCPRSLGVQPLTGDLYVSEDCEMGGLYLMKLDSADKPKPFAQNPLPVDMTMDLVQQPPRLYWADKLRHGIFSCNATGGDLRAHWRSSASSSSSPFSLTVFESRLYWAQTGVSGLRSVNKFTGEDLQVHTKTPVLSMAVLHASLQPINSLAVHAAACSCGHVCLAATPGGQPVCLCEQNFVLDSESGRCVHKPTQSPRLVLAADSVHPMTGNVGTVAAIVCGILSACTLLVLLLSVLFLRRPADQQPLHFSNEAYDIYHDDQKLAAQRPSLVQQEVGLSHKS